MEYTYPKSYEVKSIAEQEKILRKHFKRLPKVVNDTPPTFEPAEGEFLIPKWQLVASTYPEALQKVLDAIASTRPFYNWRASEMQKFSETEQKALAFKNMPDMMLIPAQFGLLHRGKSVKHVRSTPVEGQVWLGAYEVEIMLLTHPERLQSYDDLWIDCPGDNFADATDFSDAPYFYFGGGKVRFSTGPLAFASEDYGSASGFLSQSILESRSLDSFEGSGSLTLEARVEALEEWKAKVNKWIGQMAPPEF